MGVNEGNKIRSLMSYDVKQNINTRPIGVINYNTEIRSQLLTRNIGDITPNNNKARIGYIADFYSNESSKPTSLGEDGLLGYTHIFQSDYQHKINEKYDIGEEITYYQHGSLPDANSLRWNGNYDNYVSYISDYFGVSPLKSVNFIGDLFKQYTLDNISQSNVASNYATYRNAIYDLIQYDNIKYAMEKTRIGTITPNPIAAFTGVITTNINNASGKDTPLGVITNFLYANALNNDAHFNSLRKTKYITPSAYVNIGNKLSTISLLGSDIRINDATGRISFDMSRGNGTVSYEDMTLSDFLDKISIEESTDTNYSRYVNLYANVKDTNTQGLRKIYSPFKDQIYQGYISAKTNKRNDVIRTLEQSDGLQSAFDVTNKILKIWNEGPKSGKINEDISNVTNLGSYQSITTNDDDNSLLAKTQRLFRDHSDKGIDTLVGRFYTEGGTDKEHNKSSLLQTAVSLFGMSHGRNLLSKEAYTTGKADVKINGYENPYCRVWTYHNQYDNISNLIRPFGVESVSDTVSGQTVTTSTTRKIHGISDLQRKWQYGRPAGSVGHLSSNTVLNPNGFVNITPIENGGTVTTSIKNCMFSIENLAWKDVAASDTNIKNLAKEQQGPNGGRIMWFPPYDLKFNENVSVNWNPVEFIGRGEKIYTYTNTERSGTLSFIMLVDHPSVVDAWKKNKTGSSDDEQTLLRFFAGCEMLEIDGTSASVYKEDAQSSASRPVTTQPNNTKQDIFYIFFPHNYSGKNDTLDNAIEYLTTKYGCDETNGGNEDVKINDKTVKRYRTDKDTALFTGLDTDINKIDTATKYTLNKNINSFIDKSTSSEKKGDGAEAKEGELPKISDIKDATHSFTEIDSAEDYAKTKDIQEITIIPYGSSQEYYVSTEETTDESTGDVTITKTPYNSVKNSNRKRNDRDEISERRGLFAKKYVKRKLKVNEDKITLKTASTVTLASGVVSVSDITAKTARCVKIVVDYYDKRESLLQELKANNPEGVYEGKSYDDMTYDELLKEQKRLSKEKKKKDREDKKAAKRAKRAENKKIRQCSRKNPRADHCDETDMVNSINEVKEPPVPEEEAPELYNVNNATVVSGYQESQDATTGNRWESEAEYFSMLQDNDSFLYGRIVDKIKYFTPAFHSITPEGFNARLAFLHQCTRQGHTYSVSDVQNSLKSSGNLAFGRPPICVLRIGDFYHTKIVIDSVTIDYENPQWDMNPEGIGMQPMFARISLNFKFLGGSDIGAPISRLQNAISFNYYANQSVYDNRADKGKYDGKTPKIDGTPWRPDNATDSATN